MLVGGSALVWSWFGLEVSSPMVKVRVSVGGFVLGHMKGSYLAYVELRIGMQFKMNVESKG